MHSINEIIMKMIMKLNTMAAILVVAISITSLMPAASQATQYQDCMKNPFASECRGISAKRSMAVTSPQRQQQQVTPSTGSDDNNSRQRVYEYPTERSMIPARQQRRITDLVSMNWPNGQQQHRSHDLLGNHYRSLPVQSCSSDYQLQQSMPLGVAFGIWQPNGLEGAQIVAAQRNIASTGDEKE